MDRNLRGAVATDPALLAGLALAQQPAIQAELTPAERAQRDADKVFKWIRMRAERPVLRPAVVPPAVELPAPPLVEVEPPLRALSRVEPAIEALSQWGVEPIAQARIATVEVGFKLD